jgi:signal transduction histidine kinase
MFEQEDVPDEAKTRLLEMQRILNRLKSITKTLLLISQIENEQFLKEDSVSLRELLAEIYDEISIRLQDKNISYSVDVPENLVLVNVNKFLMFNLFFNLINNAAKYNRENGSITIAAALEDNVWVVKVADTGIGISTEDMPLIFNRFKKLRASLKQDSFGLGLPIVQSIAIFHQIKIDVQSEQGKGTVFKLSLPDFLIKI